MRQLMALDGGRLEWHDVEAPRLVEPTDALVRPVALSICDADVMYRAMWREMPWADK